MLGLLPRAALFAILCCTDPDDPERVGHIFPRGYVYGFVTTDEGIPVDSLRVIAEVFGDSGFVPDCDAAEFTGTTSATAKTDQTGRFSMIVEWGPLPVTGEICLGIRTRPSQGSGFLESSRTGVLLAVRPEPPWDSVRVDLVAVPTGGV